MKMNKRKLRRVLRESIRSVLSESVSHPEKGECPDVYDWDKLVGIAQSMFMGRYGRGGEPSSGWMRAWNRYATGKMNIPPMLYDEVPECARVVKEIGSRQYRIQPGDYERICEAWLEDANHLSDFDWNYDPDGY